VGEAVVAKHPQVENTTSIRKRPDSCCEGEGNNVRQRQGSCYEEEDIRERPGSRCEEGDMSASDQVAAAKKTRPRQHQHHLFFYIKFLMNHVLMKHLFELVDATMFFP
jgi:hypothetical protein